MQGPDADGSAMLSLHAEQPILLLGAQTMTPRKWIEAFAGATLWLAMLVFIFIYLPILLSR